MRRGLLEAIIRFVQLFDLSVTCVRKVLSIPVVLAKRNSNTLLQYVRVYASRDSKRLSKIASRLSMLRCTISPRSPALTCQLLPCCVMTCASTKDRTAASRQSACRLPPNSTISRCSSPSRERQNSADRVSVLARREVAVRLTSSLSNLVEPSAMFQMSLASTGD